MMLVALTLHDVPGHTEVLTIGWPVRLVKLNAIVMFWLDKTVIGFDDVGLVIARLYADRALVGEALMPNSCSKNLKKPPILDRDWLITKDEVIDV